MKIFTNDNTNIGSSSFTQKTYGGSISGEHNINYYKTQLGITTDNFIIWSSGGMYANNDWNNSYIICLVFNGKTTFAKSNGSTTEFNTDNVPSCFLTGSTNIGIEII